MRHPHLRTAVICLAAAIVISGVGPVPFRHGSAEGAYLSAELPRSSVKDWEYYEMPVLIDNYKGQEWLVDHQVRVVVDTASLISAGKMLPDGGDIRFVDQDGYTPLPFWIGPGWNTSATEMWVKVTEIPAQSGITITMWYGDETARDLSSGDDTFLFFDDFGDGNYTDRWTEAYPGTGGTESNGTLKMPAGDIRELSSVAYFGGPCIVETRVRCAPGGDQRTALYENGTGNGGEMGIDHYADSFYIRRTGAEFGGEETLFLDGSNSGWNEFRGILHGTEWRVQRGARLDNITSNANLTLAGYADDRNYRIRLNSSGAGDAEWDWIRVRAFSSVEPVVSLGSEIVHVEDHLEVSPAVWTMTVGRWVAFDFTMFLSGDSFAVLPELSVDGGGRLSNRTFTAESVGRWTLHAQYRNSSVDVPIHVIEPVASEGVIIEVGIDLGLPEGWIGARITTGNDTIELGSNGTVLGIGFDADDGSITLDVGGDVGTASDCEMFIPQGMVPDIDDISVRVNGTAIPRLDGDVLQTTKAWDASSVIDGFRVGKLNADVHLELRMMQKSVKQRVEVLLRSPPSASSLSEMNWCFFCACGGLTCLLFTAAAAGVAIVVLRRKRRKAERF